MCYIHVEGWCEAYFCKKRNNLYYLRAKITDKVVINNYTTQEPHKVLLVVSDDEDSDDDDMPELEEQNHEDSDSSNDEEEEDTPPVCAPITRKKTVLFKDAITNNPIAMQEKLETINISDAHHKWGHQGEERLRNIGKLMGFRLVGKLKPCDSCGFIKTEAKPISTVSDTLKKANTVGEHLFVDITRPVSLTAARWQKAMRNKVFWHRISNQFSGKMITSFQYSKKE